MAGKRKDVGLVNQVESIMIQIDHYFQVQYDYQESWFIFKSLVNEFAKHSTKINHFISYNKKIINGEGAQN